MMASHVKILMNVLIQFFVMLSRMTVTQMPHVQILLVHTNVAVMMVTSETELIAKTQMSVELILLELLVVLLMVSGILMTATPMPTVLTTSDLSIVLVMMDTLVTEHSAKMSTNVMMLL